MSFTRKLLYSIAALSTGLYFLFLGLVHSKGFLAPVVTAIILALLMIPVSNKLEYIGLNRGFSSLVSTLILMIFATAFSFLVLFQIKAFVDDWDSMEDAVNPKIEQLERYLINETALNSHDVLEFKEKGKLSSLINNSESDNSVFIFFGAVIGFIVDCILMFVYVFFLLLYRKMFKRFILKLFSEEKQKEVRSIIDQTAKISQHYLSGRLILMIVLAILYSIGLGLSGVNNFILISLIAAVLSLIPFVGNIIGLFIALGFGFMTTGETSLLLGVIITFAVAQFIDTYVLQPFILGGKVNIHPLFVIMVVILGYMVWGIIGMVLAIPVLGILNITFNHIRQLKPLGYLLSNPTEDIE